MYNLRSGTLEEQRQWFQKALQMETLRMFLDKGPETCREGEELLRRGCGGRGQSLRKNTIESGGVAEIFCGINSLI